MYNWREGGPVLSLRYGAVQKDVAQWREFPMPYIRPPGPAGEVDAFFASMRLTTHVIGDNLPDTAAIYGSSSHTVETSQDARSRVVRVSWAHCRKKQVIEVTHNKREITPHFSLRRVCARIRSSENCETVITTREQRRTSCPTLCFCKL